jgi:hypothetical protein
LKAQKIGVRGRNILENRGDSSPTARATTVLGLHPGKMDASILDSLVSHTDVVTENWSVFTTNRHGSALEGMNDAPTSTSFNVACHCRDASSNHTEVLYSICTARPYQNK